MNAFAPKPSSMVAKGGLGNILNEKYVRFSDGAHLKI